MLWSCGMDWTFIIGPRVGAYKHGYEFLDKFGWYKSLQKWTLEQWNLLVRMIILFWCWQLNVSPIIRLVSTGLLLEMCKSFLLGLGVRLLSTCLTSSPQISIEDHMKVVREYRYRPILVQYVTGRLIECGTLSSERVLLRSILVNGK
jgi:hypothetical protein